MTNQSIGFRPTKKALQLIKDYIVINELKGRGAITRAINELIESHENVVIFPIMRYARARNENLINF